METVACDLCGSKNYDFVTKQTDLIHLSTKDDFSIVECRECGLNYTNPRPSPDEMKVFYSKSYSFHQTKGIKTLIKRSFLGEFLRWFANSPFGNFLFFVPIFSRFLASQVRPKIKDPVLSCLKEREVQSFLDIGCGSGLDPHFWRDESSLVSISKGIESFGCEPDPSSRKFLNDSGIKCWADIEEVEEDRCFDLIRLNWSLEHVHDPSRYFEFISKHLTPLGTAIIAVPNYSGLIYQIAPNCVELPIHLYHFSERDLREYAKKYSLEVSKVVTFSYPGMFSFASKVGLISSKFSFPKGIIQAKHFQKTLNLFDAAGLGNDIIVTLGKK